MLLSKSLPRRSTRERKSRRSRKRRLPGFAPFAHRVKAVCPPKLLVFFVEPLQRHTAARPSCRRSGRGLGGDVQCRDRRFWKLQVRVWGRRLPRHAALASFNRSTGAPSPAIWLSPCILKTADSLVVLSKRRRRPGHGAVPRLWSHRLRGRGRRQDGEERILVHPTAPQMRVLFGGPHAVFPPLQELYVADGDEPSTQLNIESIVQGLRFSLRVAKLLGSNKELSQPDSARLVSVQKVMPSL
mmetsp:Transcript_7582/g.20716  ORF Transcript_7582/g.20716 Transcript_7582/m.20716 type:complete len:242 (+) Transcript_7582:721-1446(+)